ncbi:hypothetical protein BHUM_01558 [Candidatus Burkholderia humilis]|nr:hypothetical protein BHUM_01558 [Candidatus Burkholderia humilis]
MIRTIERIESEYARARKAETLEAFDTMSIGEVEDLVLIPRRGLDTIVARLEMLEQEMYERHFEESFADLGLQGFTEDRPPGTENLVDVSASADRADNRTAERPKFSFFDHFFGYFARKPKQVA